MKSINIIVLISILILVITACTPTGQVVQEQEIEIGFIGPLTGFATFVGQEMVRGTEVALAEINQEGGINEKELKIIYEDGQCFPKPALNAFQKLATFDEVPVIIGPLCSTSILPVTPMANNNKLPIIGTLDSSEDIKEAGEYVFSNGFLLEDGAIKMADYAYNEMGLRKVAVLYELDDSAQILATTFRDEFIKLGGEIVVVMVHSLESNDYRTELLKIQQYKPEAVYAVVLTLDGSFFKQIKELGIETPFIGADNFGIQDVIDGAGDAANGVIFSYQIKYGKENQALTEFQEKYKAMYGEESPGILYAAIGYDNVKLVAEVMREHGTTSEEIKNGLLQVKDFEGVLGTTSFDEKGNANREQHINKIENGEFVNIE
ncbi:penicillin-binding protein activator [Candidatus Woesearchaeota archaeon]|nr:penicillin-binding protein activator [Candidatus Woesearchaeota archaeon]